MFSFRQLSKSLANLTLRKKVTLLTTLGLVLTVIVFGFLGTQAINQATDAMLQDRLTTAQLVADYLDEALGRALVELESVAQLTETDRVDSSFEVRMKELQDTYSRLSIRTFAIYLVGEQGQVIWSQPENPAIMGKTMLFYNSISQAITEGKTNVSGLVLAPETDSPVVLLTSPTKEQPPNRGAIAVAVDVRQSGIGGFIHPIRLGQTGYVEIVDQNGVVVVRTEPGPQLFPFEKSDHSGRFAALIAAGEPTRGLCHTCHEPVQKVERRDMLAFVPLSKARWGVAIRQSEDEALAPVGELRMNLLLFGAALITVALLFVWITTRDVVSRIRMLTRASQRIAYGDLTSPITSVRKDEIGILSQSFEEMRIKLETSREEVQQRTRELSSLLSVSEILTSLSDLSNLDTALANALDKTLEIMQANTGGILLLDEEKQMLTYRVHRGLSDEYARQICLRLGEGIAGRVAQSGESILVEDISQDHRVAYADMVTAEGLRSFASVPLRAKRKVLGVLNIIDRAAQRFSPQDLRLLEGIAGQIATAIENARLHREVQRKDEMRGELLGRIFSIQEEERKRIARELHDETSQMLASLTANLEAASGMLPTDSDKARSRLRESQNLSISILDEVHRLIYELRPSLLDDLGLVTATRWLADNNLSGVNVNFKTVGRVRRLDSQLETTLFRVIQETIYNIARHAKAGNADISLHFKKSAIGVCIKDDGIGFDIEEAISSKDRPRGLGLLGMRERIELVNGVLSIKSRPGGGGTEINIKIPLNREVTSGKDTDSTG